MYEKENDIKLLMHTQKITFIQYYIGKFLVDIFMITLNLMILYTGFTTILSSELISPNNASCLKLFKDIIY